METTCLSALYPRGEKKVGCSPINLQELMYRVDGNVDLLDQMVSLFFKVSPVLIMRIEDGIQRCDGDSVRHAAHNLKGMASNFASVSILDTLRSIESIGETGDFSKANELLQLLKDHLEDLSDALRELRKENKNAVSF